MNWEVAWIYSIKLRFQKDHILWFVLYYGLSWGNNHNHQVFKSHWVCTNQAIDFEYVKQLPFWQTEYIVVGKLQCGTLKLWREYHVTIWGHFSKKSHHARGFSKNALKISFVTKENPSRFSAPVINDCFDHKLLLFLENYQSAL